MLTKPETEASANLVRFFLFFCVAALIWALSVLVSEHHFHPFAVYHNDHYSYVGLHADGYGMSRYFKLYPRPLGYVILELCGRLGIRWLMAPMFICGLANAALMGTLVERRLKRSVPLLAFVLFAGMVYLNPWYQIHVKEDPLAIFSLSFTLMAFHVWQSYVDNPRPWHIPVIVALLAASSMTKESYFCVIGLFFLIQMVFQRGKRAASGFVLAVASGFMFYALHRASTVWLLFHGKAKPTDPYYTDMHPGAVIHGFITLGQFLIYPALAAAIVLILIFAWRTDKRVFWVGLASVALGLAALLPNSTLPNHLEPQYAVLGSELFCAPILLIWWVSTQLRSRALIAGTVTLLSAFSIVEYVHGSRNEVRWFQIQESVAGRMVASLEQIRRETPAGSTFLVTGIAGPYDPFYADDFIQALIGTGRFFRVIVPDGVPRSAGKVTELIHAADPARMQAVSDLLVFDEDGSLARAVPHPSPEQLADGRALAPIPAPEAAEYSRSAQFRLWATAPPSGVDRNAPVEIIHWSAPGIGSVEVRVESPAGKLFAVGGSTGEATTGPWARPGLAFYLQDASQGDSTLAGRTLARMTLK